MAPINPRETLKHFIPTDNIVDLNTKWGDWKKLWPAESLDLRGGAQILNLSDNVFPFGSPKDYIFRLRMSHTKYSSLVLWFYNRHHKLRFTYKIRQVDFTGAFAPENMQQLSLADVIRLMMVDQYYQGSHTIGLPEIEHIYQYERYGDAWNKKSLWQYSTAALLDELLARGKRDVGDNWHNVLYPRPTQSLTKKSVA